MDLISRQAAIDAIQAAYIYTDGGEDKNAVWTNVGLTNALHIMQDLPSAQPEKMQLSREDATFDCISRQAAIDEINDELDAIDHVPKWVFVRLTRRIEQLPSVQPEIIRCKDCEHYELTEWAAHRCNLLGRSVYGNDFCAWAEPYKGE